MSENDSEDTVHTIETEIVGHRVEVTIIEGDSPIPSEQLLAFIADSLATVYNEFVEVDN